MTENEFPIAQQIMLPGHFGEAVGLEAVRRIGSGYERRVRLLDGTPDEAILSADETKAQAGQEVGRHWRFHRAIVDRWLGEPTDQEDGGRQ